MSSDHPLENWLDRILALVYRLLAWWQHAPRQSAPAPIKVPPSQVTKLHSQWRTPTAVALAWDAPKAGTPPILFTVFMRKRGSPYWDIGAFSKVPSAVVDNLTPNTVYDFEIMAHNN